MNIEQVEDATSHESEATVLKWEFGWRGLDLSSFDGTKFRQRFWCKVEIGEPDDCWEWKKHRQKAGYGQFTVRKGLFAGAHRISFVLANSPLLPGELVRHSCDNPPCVNPKHLLRGSPRQNAMDAVERGRAKRSHGEQHLDHRLTVDDVRHIRSLTLKYGDKTALARRYGVSLCCISRVLNFQTWRHV